jgi:hypothetical protein
MEAVGLELRAAELVLAKGGRVQGERRQSTVALVKVAGGVCGGFAARSQGLSLRLRPERVRSDH